MTPTQLRAFAAVVRLGSVRSAAAELAVSEAAISTHVAKLRQELGDKLFTPTAAGLAFTPGGLRLASRASEMLGLQDRTIVEVGQAGSGRRLLRVATSSLFAEHAAPGLIDLFAGRADDLDVELSVHNSRSFEDLLISRSVDVAIGPKPPRLQPGTAYLPFLHYTISPVVKPDYPLPEVASIAAIRDHTWLLGPSASSDGGVVAAMVGRVNVPEDRQRIFQSHAAAIDEVKRGKGIGLALDFAFAQDLAEGTIRRITCPGLRGSGEWGVLTLEGRDTSPTAAELARFVTTPRATQAMVKGAGVTLGRFRPSLHVTLWS